MQDIIKLDTKDLKVKSETIKKLANDYSDVLKELYQYFSKLKDNGVISGSGNVDVFINSIKNDLVTYNKLSTEIKRTFEAIDNFSNDLESLLRRVENDKIIL